MGTVNIVLKNASMNHIKKEKLLNVLFVIKKHIKRPDTLKIPKVKNIFVINHVKLNGGIAHLLVINTLIGKVANMHIKVF